MRGSALGTMLATAWAITAPLQAQTGQAAVVVLPFENTGSYGQDKENFDALEVGLPAVLASTLSAHPGLRTLDRGAVKAAMDKSQIGTSRRIDAASATQVAKAAGARYVVTGSFADFYGKFRINARVVDGESGEILKVVSNDDPKLQDRAQLAAILQLVSERIVQAIGLPPLPDDQGAKRRAVPTAALTDYSRGLLFEGRGDRAKAAEAFQRALSAYPDYPDARNGLQRVSGA
ncbi:MAG: CsgG/HfaB family protein [Gemmatimonadales bacterium]